MSSPSHPPAQAAVIATIVSFWCAATRTDRSDMEILRLDDFSTLVRFRTPANGEDNEATDGDVAIVRADGGFVYQGNLLAPVT